MFNQYILILVWIGVMALIQGSYYRQEYNELTGEWDWRVGTMFAIVVMAPVIWMAANRVWIGDSLLYAQTFHGIPNSWQELPQYFVTIKKDPGYYFSIAVLKQIIGDNTFRFFLCMAGLHGLVLAAIYRKYSQNYVLSVFLFLAATDYISWMFNGIRQFTAVVIIFAASPLLFKRKYIRLLFCVLIASFFHQSALIMVPIVFIAQGQAWNKKTIFLLAGAVLAVVFVGRFTGLLDDALSNTQYANVISDYTAWNDNGTNPLRVLVYCVPAIISFVKRTQIRQMDDALINVCVNMSVATAGIYLVSMVTSGIFIGRLPIYCSLYNYILLPWEVNTLFQRDNSKLIKIAMIFGYLVFYYYQMHVIFRLF